MAVSQLPQAPYRQDRKIFPTPIVGDVLFSEVRDCNRGNPFPEYGTPHPNPQRWPDHKLVYIKPVDIERNEIFEFFYAADRQNQDLYNFSFGLQNIAGTNRQFRTVQRTYITLRSDFQPLDIEFGTPMPDVPEGKFEGVEYVFFDRQQQRIGQQELDSLYVTEAHTYIEKAFLEYKLSYTSQKTDPTPEKFKVLIPEQSTEELVEGIAEMPTLSANQLAVKEDQINPDIKLVRTTSRDKNNFPISLSQKATTNEKQIATVTETIQTGDTTASEVSATVDIQSEALGDGTYLVRKTEVPELFTAETYAAERPDVTPQKFRVAIPTTTTDERVEGIAESPTLTTGDLAATEQQENEFVKRVRKTKRDTISLPVSLTQQATTNEKQLATVTETLQAADTVESPTALVDIQSEALGDGTFLVRKTKVDELFTAKTYAVERPTEVIPLKFRVAVPTTTTDERVEGIAASPILATGDLAATEQQENEFVKRVRKTKRDTVSLPVSLEQKVTTNDKQLATVTETLQAEDTVESPTALVDIQSEALGDGTYLVRETKIDRVFDALSMTSQKPDVIPDRFQNNTPLKIEEKNIEIPSEGGMPEPQVSGDETSRTHQKINDFVYRERIVSRSNVPSSIVLPTYKKAFVEGHVVDVDEKLTTSPSVLIDYNTAEASVTPIGDDKYIVQEATANWKTLTGQDWDNVIGAVVPYTKEFVPSGFSSGEDYTTIQPINEYRSLQITERPPTQALNSFSLSFPTTVDLQLPRVLKSIKVNWIQENGDGDYDSDWTGRSAGERVSLQGSERADASGTATVVPKVELDIEQPWGGDVPATAYVFFLPFINGGISSNQIQSKCGALGNWPHFKPQSHIITATGAKISVKATANASASYSSDGDSSSWDKTYGTGKDFDIQIISQAINIEPTIHGAITISTTPPKITARAKADAGWNGDGGFPSVYAVSNATKEFTASISHTSLSPTSPAQIPTSGRYVIRTTVEPYKWGYAKCVAIVIDAGDLK